MFGLGLWEMVVIAIVALLFVGPDKLPDAAKKISRGIRDFRKQTRELSRNIEEDTEFGAAVRDLKSALRGDDLRRIYQPPHLHKETASKPEGADGIPGDKVGDTADKKLPEGEAPASDSEPRDPDVPIVTAAADAVAKGDDTEPPADDGDEPVGKAHG